MNNPHFAVVIPTLNAAEHLADCLESVKSQLVRHGTPFSLLIFDQGSTDDTINIAQRYGTVLTIYKTFAHGEAVVRNEIQRRVAAACQATHIVCIDADELLSDDWITTAEAIIEQLNPDLIATDYVQLLGTAAYMQDDFAQVHYTIANLKSPVYWIQMGETYHATMFTPTGVAYTSTIKRIHLGYTGDLRKRFEKNILRGDWPTMNTADALAATIRNPFDYLPNIVHTPVAIIDGCRHLGEIILRHNTERRVEFSTTSASGTGPALRIHTIHYGT